MIESNIFHCAKEFKIKKLIFLGSSCVYPRECPQPMKEEYLLTGPLEPTNEGYAIAKIAGLKMAEYFHRQFQLDSLVLMPSNLYGKGDSFDPAHAHVLSSLVKKFIDAVDENKEKVINWGTGVARREFTNVDDLVHAVVFLLDKWKTPQMINVGTGEDVSIRELSDLISRLTGFSGKVEWDNSKPDGMPRKCMDVSKLNSLGFKTKISLESGIKDMILEYKKSKQEGKLK
jgi:GDP-L-fucose synthase